ncbi:MAG: hypothetical protein AVDCRST_MAG38-2003, partial [uncultured Solirubrobacteraceae bacterium]
DEPTASVAPALDASRAAGRCPAAPGSRRRGPAPGAGRTAALARLDPAARAAAGLHDGAGGHAGPRGAGRAHRSRGRLLPAASRRGDRRHGHPGPRVDRGRRALRAHAGRQRARGRLRHPAHAAALGRRLDGAHLVRLPGLLGGVGGHLRHRRERRPPPGARRRRVDRRPDRRADPGHAPGARLRGVLLPRVLLHRAAPLLRRGGRRRPDRRRLRSHPRQRHRPGVPRAARSPRRPAVPALLAHRLDHPLHGPARPQQLDRIGRRARMAAAGDRGHDARLERPDRRRGAGAGATRAGRRPDTRV